MSNMVSLAPLKINYSFCYGSKRPFFLLKPGHVEIVRTERCQQISGIGIDGKATRAYLSLRHDGNVELHGENWSVTAIRPPGYTTFGFLLTVLQHELVPNEDRRIIIGKLPEVESLLSSS